jgi:peptide chain release factor
MDKIIIQITSGRGPVECCRVVAKIQERMLEEARAAGIKIEVLENRRAELKGTLLSATLMAEGKNLDSFIKTWQGTIQWIGPSPYRKMHKRRNWFASVAIFTLPRQVLWQEKDIKLETCRASGPGGQHVNKVETAVRATHLPSGLQVQAMDSRSQLQNKKHALERLKAKVMSWFAVKMLEEQQQRWQEHNILERGNAVNTIIAPLI